VTRLQLALRDVGMLDQIVHFTDLCNAIGVPATETVTLTPGGSIVVDVDSDVIDLSGFSEFD
jgi:hypothetical protein